MTKGRGHKKRNPNAKYEKCDKTGHTTEKCHSHLKCDFCGWTGHTIDYYRKYKKVCEDEQRNNNTRGDTSRGNNVFSSALDKPEPSSSFSFTPEQCKQILSMLNTNKSNAMAHNVGNYTTFSDLSGKLFCFSSYGKMMPWIFDSGATHHMICSHTLLTFCILIHNRIVQLQMGLMPKLHMLGKWYFQPC